MSASSVLPDHVQRNRESWDLESVHYVEPGRRNWAGDPSWGIWKIPESEVKLLPDVEGKDTLELGCGTGYVSSWLARRGARPVGVDNSPKQLESALMFQREFNLRFPIILGNAEAVPLPDASFDLIISEYGASIWCDPYRWVPEAARLLRPGGELIFLTNGLLLMLCMNDDINIPTADRLVRPYFGMHRFEWPDEISVEFHLGFGDWVRLLRGQGFEIEDFIELRPAANATTRYTFVSLEWARKWPSEQVWKVRKKG